MSQDKKNKEIAVSTGPKKGNIKHSKNKKKAGSNLNHTDVAKSSPNNIDNQKKEASKNKDKKASPSSASATKDNLKKTDEQKKSAKSNNKMNKGAGVNTKPITSHRGDTASSTPTDGGATTPKTITKTERKIERKKNGQFARKTDSHITDRNKVMIEYSPLVRMVAYKIAAKLPPSVDVNDLISVGYLGLIDAFKRFDKSKNVKFKTYAEIRVSGAIQDELRSMDWLPRSVRDTIKKIERAREDVEKRLGHKTSEQDVASQMGVGIDEYQEAIGRVKNLSLVSIDDCFVSSQGEKGLAIHEKFADTTSVDPYTTLHARKIREHLIRHLSRLSEEHRAILGIYYFEEMSLREIGRIFNVSESRISQLHTQAIIKVWTDLRRSLRHDKLNGAD
jgi:RNA polymerase sigma factor for flagellar operon FliA